MDDFRTLVHDPRHKRGFEKLLRLAAGRGDCDLVQERLSWGIDPNSTSKRGRTPLIANCRGFCPNAAVVKELLAAGADVHAMDETGLTALDYARRKLAKLQLKPHKPPRKSPSLDENNQLVLADFEQEQLDEVRRRLPKDQAREFIEMYWQARLQAAKRVFNDPEQVERIVEVLEAAATKR